MDKAEINYIISKVLENIRDREMTADSIAVIPCYTPYGSELLSVLKEKEPFVSYCTTDSRVASKNGLDLVDDAVFAEKCMDARKIFILGGGLSFLRRITEADDDGIIERSVIAALLKGRDVTAILDFDMPMHIPGGKGLAEKVLEICRSAEEAGIKLLTVSAPKDADGADFISEAYILDAAERGVATVYGCPGAIVTPAARDKASELNIVIKETGR